MKSAKYVGALMLFIGIVALFTACTRSPNGPVSNNSGNHADTIIVIDTTHHTDTTHHGPTTLSRLDIAGARSLFIVSSNSSAKRKASAAVDSGTLFKITPSGYAVKVTCFGHPSDSSDTAVDTITSQLSPIAMCSLSDSFLTVTYQNYGTYLIRKSDGAAFGGSKLPSSFPDPWIYDRSDLFKQQDAQGNIYYVYNQEVVKLTITDPNNLTVTTYSAEGDQVNKFVVDKAGNMAYGMGQISRYRHAAGGFENFSQQACSAEWTDVNGDYIYGRKGSMNISRIAPSSPLQFENYGDSTFVENGLSHLVKVKNKGRVVGDGCDLVFDLFNRDGVVNKFPIANYNVSKINMLASSDNYYYIIGTNAALQSVLLKVDPNDQTYTNLLTTGDYDIYNVVVSGADDVQFYALRMSDGKRVLAGIDNAGVMSVLTVLDGSSITALERIN